MRKKHWEEMSLHRGWSRVINGHVLLVHMVGTSWGYTIWRGGFCLAGACDWDWGAEQAKQHAEAELQKIPGGVA